MCLDNTTKQISVKCHLNMFMFQRCNAQYAMFNTNHHNENRYNENKFTHETNVIHIIFPTKLVFVRELIYE